MQMTVMKSVVECAVFLVCGDGADQSKIKTKS